MGTGFVFKTKSPEEEARSMRQRGENGCDRFIFSVRQEVRGGFQERKKHEDDAKG